jgi:uncharacterized protein (TIGR00251 family)
VSAGSSQTKIGEMIAPSGNEKFARLKIYVSAPPESGKANAAIIALLSSHFKVPKSKISILKGATQSNKTIFVNSVF